jgi:hypothetical protein
MPSIADWPIHYRPRETVLEQAPSSEQPTQVRPLGLSILSEDSAACNVLGQTLSSSS